MLAGDSPRDRIHTPTSARVHARATRDCNGRRLCRIEIRRWRFRASRDDALFPATLHPTYFLLLSAAAAFVRPARGPNRLKSQCAPQFPFHLAPSKLCQRLVVQSACIWQTYRGNIIYIYIYIYIFIYVHIFIYIHTHVWVHLADDWQSA